MRFKIPKTKKTEPLYYKVYYEKATGQIISISIKDKPSLDTHFTTTFNEVCEFIDGTKSLINYKVTYDLQKTKFHIVHKDDKIVLDVDNLIHKITQSGPAQLCIIKDNILNEWQLHLDLNLTAKNNINNAGVLDEILWFSITQENNPNILYRHFSASMHELINEQTMSFKFLNHKETDVNKYSIYTNKRLVSYSKREIHEPN